MFGGYCFFLGWVPLFIFLVLPSNPGQNKYGTQPGNCEPSLSTTPEFVPWGLYCWWVLATTVGGVVNALLLVGILRVGTVEPMLGRWILGIFIICAASTMVGVPQWLVLRRYLAQAHWWLPATISDHVLVEFLKTVSPVALYEDSGNVHALGALAFWFALGGGAVVGILQWIVLRRHLDRAVWWVLASLVAVVAGSSIVDEVSVMGGFALDAVFYGIATPTVILAVPAVVGGVVYGMITGVALMLLLGYRTPAPRTQ